MTEQITESKILHDCPECSDKGVINKPCVLCCGTGKVEPYSPCPNPGCDGWVYDYGESAWCLTCDVQIAATGCNVGSALVKLNSRRLRGKIQGSGDNR